MAPNPTQHPVFFVFFQHFGFGGGWGCILGFGGVCILYGGGSDGKLYTFFGVCVCECVKEACLSPLSLLRLPQLMVECYTISASPPQPLQDPLSDRECDWEARCRPISHPHAVVGVLNRLVLSGRKKQWKKQSP